MGKRVLIIVLSLALCVSAFAKVSIDLRGFGILLNPSDFTADISKTAWAFGYEDADLASEFGGFTGGGGAGFKFFVSDNISIDILADFFFTEEEITVTNESTGATMFISNAALSTAYLGAGATYHINLEGSSTITPYISANAGALIMAQGFWEVWTDPTNLTMLFNPRYNVLETDPDYNAYSDYDFAMGFGGQIETGVNIMFSDSAGMSLFGGYRIASVAIDYPDTGIWTENNNIDSNGEPIFTASTLDLSGPFFGAGLLFTIGGEAAAKQPAATRPAVDTGASQYEQYGDYYFKAKNYDAALKYYAAARKQTPQRADVYKKIGMCYFYLKQNANAVRYLQYY
ncbi:MAG TPA: tetratricopeptide repeat protein, partial [Firmicutes bacterium]|nr:tetratricopeptide repeat protein [Bacillota bacterium]